VVAGLYRGRRHVGSGFYGGYVEGREALSGRAPGPFDTPSSAPSSTSCSVCWPAGGPLPCHKLIASHPRSSRGFCGADWWPRASGDFVAFRSTAFWSRILSSSSAGTRP
jgi:hypothetical protein